MSPFDSRISAIYFSNSFGRLSSDIFLTNLFGMIKNLGFISNKRAKARLNRLV
jgi:hypothetical protein